MRRWLSDSGLDRRFAALVIGSWLVGWLWLAPVTLFHAVLFWPLTLALQVATLAGCVPGWVGGYRLGRAAGLAPHRLSLLASLGAALTGAAALWVAATLMLGAEAGVILLLAAPILVVAAPLLALFLYDPALWPGRHLTPDAPAP